MPDPKPNFADYFSAVADQYADYRPSYPPALFEWLNKIVPGHDLAWDCACGNGQASLSLAEYFKHVVATDASAAQIAAAKPNPKIEYRLAKSDASGLGDASVDLITVATALHWFDNDGFYNEAKRVLKPEGVLAAWSYPLFTIEDKNIYQRIRAFFDQIDSFWPPERQHVVNRYKSLSFPLTPIETPPIRMEVSWNLPQLAGYLRTWSAVQQYIKRKDKDPVSALEHDLLSLWNDPESPKSILWDLVLRAGKN